MILKLLEPKQGKGMCWSIPQDTRIIERNKFKHLFLTGNKIGIITFKLNKIANTDIQTISRDATLCVQFISILLCWGKN